MIKPKIDHIQITVRNLKAAEPIYDKFLVCLGYDLKNKSKGRVDANDFDVIEYYHPMLTIGINSPREVFKEDKVHRRKPGSIHHLAFSASSKEEVDEVYLEIKETGVEIVDEPKYYPQHGEKYYALFFKDPDGIKFEVMYEEKPATLL